MSRFEAVPNEMKDLIMARIDIESIRPLMRVSRWMRVSVTRRWEECLQERAGARNAEARRVIQDSLDRGQRLIEKDQHEKIWCFAHHRYEADRYYRDDAGDCIWTWEEFVVGGERMRVCTRCGNPKIIQYIMPRPQ